MFFGLLLLLSRAENDEYRFELKHIYNPYCGKYTVTNKKISISSTNNFEDTSYYLRECKNFDSVDYSLGSVPNYAFYASSIKTISFTADTTSIGIGSFAFCKSLTSVTFADATITISIGQGAFYHSTLTSFTRFPDITTINSYTFEGCSLSGYTFDLRGKSLTNINENAFHSSDLKEVIFPEDITEIAQSAFQNCTSLSIGNNGRIKSDTIGPYAFANCPLVTKITVISKEIGEGAFQCDPNNPTSITSIQQISTTAGTPPETIYSPLTIDPYAFYGREVSLSGLATYRDIKINSFAFAFCSFTNTAQNSGYGLHILNENSPITIGDHAFYRTKLNSNANTPFMLRIGESDLASTDESIIGYHAFESSEGHLRLQFDEDFPPVTIQNYAFYRSGVYNSKADDETDFLRLLERVSSIGKRSFAECQLIAGGVYLRSTVIDEYAFYDCKSIKKIVIYNSNIAKGAFEACTGDITNLTITDDRHLSGSDATDQQQITIGERAFYASGLNCELVLHSFIETIGEYAFAYCTNLVRHPITIFATEIKPYAFASCGTFNSPITIYSEEIDYHCFDENTLSDIRIGRTNGGTATINTEAFYDITFTGLVNIEKDASIEYNAFQLCSFNRDITINATINEYAFDNCTVASSGVTLSIGATSVGNHAFQRFGKRNTFTLIFHDIHIGTYSIGRHAFYEANISGFVNIPWCYNDIKDYAFTNCISITSLVVNNSNIGNYAFDGCQRLARLELYSHGDFDSYTGMKTIGSHAFNSLAQLANDLIIPKEVTTISDHAFADCSRIPKLIIESESKLTEIGIAAFTNCTAMQGQINVTEPLETIDQYAFFNCPRLEKITFFNENPSLTTIGQYAFHGCTQMNGVLDIPSKVSLIGDYAFYNCNGFNHHLTINSACTIGDYAFYRCSNIKRVELNFPENIIPPDPIAYNNYRYIGSYAFSGLPVYNNFHLDSTNDKDEEEDDTFRVPDYIYRIGESAFENCLGLRKLRINIKSDYDRRSNLGIMNRAFYGSSIISVSITGSNNYLYYIGDYAFSNCPNLASGITIQGGHFGDFVFANNRNFIDTISITDGYFGNCIFANNQNFVSGISISGGTFGNYIFANCSSLRGRVTIRGGYFGEYLFQNCVNIAPDIENVTFEMTGGSIGRFPFEGCTSFGGIVILSGSATLRESAFEGFSLPFTLEATNPNSNVDVERRAFYNCQLTGPLDISGIKNFGNEAFASCPNSLLSLTIYPEETGRNVFANTKFENNTVPDAIVPLTVYTGSEFTQNFLQGLTFNRLYFESGSSGYDIPYKAFYGMSTLQGELNIPSSVSSIGEYAFSGCGFYHIEFDSSPQLKEGVFYNCKNLNDTIDLNSIDVIAKRAFCGCSNLQAIEFKTIPTFERSAFEGCSSLNFDVRLPHIDPDDYTGSIHYTIHKYAFSGCSSLDGTHGHLRIPIYVQTIEDYAFQGCAFQHLDFTLDRTFTPELPEDPNPPPDPTPAPTPDPNPLTIGTGAFSGCTKISFELILPNLINDKIPDRAFSGCSGITAIEYPDSITTIGKYAFYGCSNVRGALEIKPSVKRIEEYAFAKCSGYSGSLTINIDPKAGSQLIIGPHAFEGCSGFKDGELNIFVESDEESSKPYTNTGENQNQFPYFRYKYFLRIGTKAFKDTKFKNIFYNGRFQPDCDYDIGFSHTKGIHTSSNYLNKSFCSYPLHSNKLSGGAIAGIVIACIVVVAVIIFLILFFILKNKKNKDKSEDEIEMNQDP